MNLADVERAVTLSFELAAIGPNDSRADLKQQATAFINEVESSPQHWRVGLELFLQSHNDHARFYGLQRIVSSLERDELVVSDRQVIRSQLMGWMRGQALDLGGTKIFLRNKAAVSLALLVKRDFPDSWPEAFSELLQLASASRESAGLLLKALDFVTEEIVAELGARNSEERDRNNRVKDAMRAGPLPAIVDFWFQIMSNVSESGEELVTRCLNVMRGYIPWIDVGLVVNDRFIPILYSFLGMREFRVQALKVFCEIVRKGMPSANKVELIVRLDICAILVGLCEKESIKGDGKTGNLVLDAGLANGSVGDQDSDADDDDDDDDDNEEDGWGFRENIAALVRDVGLNFISARLELPRQSPQYATALDQLANKVLPLAIYQCLAFNDQDAQETIVELFIRIVKVYGDHVDAEMGQFMNTMASRSMSGKRSTPPLPPDADLDRVIASALAQILPILLREIAYPDQLGLFSAMPGSGQNSPASAEAGGPFAHNHHQQQQLKSAIHDEHVADFEEHRDNLRRLYKYIVNHGAIDIALPFLKNVVQETFDPSRISALPAKQVEATIILLYDFKESAPPGTITRCVRSILEQAQLANRMFLRERTHAAATGTKPNLPLGPPPSNDLAKAGAEDDRRTKAREEFTVMVAAVHRCGLWKHPNSKVVLAYVDFANRYIHVLQRKEYRDELIGPVLEGLVQSGGITHPDATVRSSVCYTLLGIVKGLGPAVAPYAPQVLNSLKVHLIVSYDAVLANMIIEEEQEHVEAGRAPPVITNLPVFSIQDSMNLFEVASALILSDPKASPVRIKEQMQIAMEPVYKQLEEIVKNVPSISKSTTLSEEDKRRQVKILGNWAAESINALSQLTKSVSVGKHGRAPGKAGPSLNKHEKIANDAPGSCDIDHTNAEAAIAIGDLFKMCLNTALLTLDAIPNHDLLCTRIVTMLHCTVRVLGEASIDFAPAVGVRLLEQSTSLEHMLEAVQLINQLISIFKGKLLSTIDPLLIRVLSHVTNILGSIPDPFEGLEKAPKQQQQPVPQQQPANGGLATRAEILKAEARNANGREGIGLGSLTTEQVDYRKVKRALIQLLSNLVVSDLDMVLYSPANVVHLETVFDLVITSLARFPDPSCCQKHCVKILAHLCTIWLDPAKSASLDPNVRNAFVRVLLENASVASFQAVSLASFSPEDYESCKLLDKICQFHQTLTFCLGQQWLQHLVEKTLPSVACPQPLAIEYARLLSDATLSPKVLRKHFMRLFI